MRDSAQQEVPAAEVVRGDLLVLAEGDIIPADARLGEAAALLVDESALSGESVPVDTNPSWAPRGRAGPRRRTGPRRNAGSRQAGRTQLSSMTA
ncbi:hypothetical protein [Nonomuraea sp. NPDC049400]|uniref:P-type ATPase n=1 Tax=Nonomuraea sp. NPDC049400 TaxID=3364352 RepID=UPI0037A3DA9A